MDHPRVDCCLQDLATRVAGEIRELAGEERNEVWVVAHSLGVHPHRRACPAATRHGPLAPQQAPQVLMSAWD